MRSTLPMLAAAVAILFTTTSQAETSAWIDRDPQASFAYSPPEAPHRHSSTYQEGVLRGQAALTRAQGDFNLLDAQAEILREQAYSMRLDNFINLGKTHFEWKNMITDYNHQERVNRIVRREELHQLKQLSQSRQDLRAALEYPLSENEVDFSTGTVYWPALVAGPRYAEYRVALNELMADMLRNGAAATAADRQQLNKLCNDFRRQVRADFEAHVAKSLPSVQAEYSAVERLLKGLRYTPVVMSQVVPSDTLSMR